MAILYHNFVNISTFRRFQSVYRPEMPEMHLQNFATSHPNHAEGVYEIKAKPCMELRRSRVWNHHEVMYGINPKAEKREYALKRDAMPSRSDGLHATRGAR